ncbi:MAG: PadR family transcriptional regulator [Chlamydiia bacterium]|nr:PadR family transcriptional regulator [Chlamydiia bacterium]
MSVSSKTRYAILGMLLEKPSTGYEIKAFMGRSTAYFWRESDSTIYPMLKVLAKEGKVVSQVVYVGKKKKEVFSITKTGRAELKAWIKSETKGETPRNEFLLKLFFATEKKEAMRLFQERLEKSQALHEEYKEIEKRLASFPDSSRKAIRLDALKYGIKQLKVEIQWLKKGIKDNADY